MLGACLISDPVPGYKKQARRTDHRGWHPSPRVGPDHSHGTGKLPRCP